MPYVKSNSGLAWYDMPFKGGPVSSPQSSPLQDLTSQIEGLLKSLNSDLGALENVQSEISNSVEEALGIESTIRARMSTLRTVASQLETYLRSEKKLQQYSSVPEQAVPASQPVAGPAAPAAATGEVVSGPAPLQPGQGLAYLIATTPGPASQPQQTQGWNQGYPPTMYYPWS